jgi:adenylate cyclase
MTATTRRKLAAVLMAMIIFACLGAVTTAAVGRPVEIGAFNAVLIGAGIGLFEEFYVQGSRATGCARCIRCARSSSISLW